MTNDTLPLKKYIWGSIIVAMAIGVLMIGFISGYMQLGNQTFINTFGCGILIAGASFSAGGFLGFIFGIPSILQNPSARLKYNDNLVQISDWLTKIIVGVGLTQLYKIPGYIKKIGVQFRINFGGGDWATNVAVSIICYFFLLGFLMMYFWTKTDYSTIMKEMDDDLNEQLANTQLQLENETKRKEEAQQETQEKQKLLEVTNKEIELKNEEIGALSQSVPGLGKTDTAFSANDNDTQKGKWGGHTEMNERKVQSTVRTTTFSDEWFLVNLEVISTNPNKPLKGSVVFHLHETFVPPDRIVNVRNGIADLQVVAWGAFTVGIECDNGETKLEIDLAELTDAPKLFRER